MDPAVRARRFVQLADHIRRYKADSDHVDGCNSCAAFHFGRSMGDLSLVELRVELIRIAKSREVLDGWAVLAAPDPNVDPGPPGEVGLGS